MTHAAVVTVPLAHFTS